jgi:hypothetical protein
MFRETDAWNLYLDPSLPPDAEIVIDQDVAWRLFTKGISKDEARVNATLIGDQSLGLKLFETVSVIA